MVVSNAFFHIYNYKMHDYLFRGFENKCCDAWILLQGSTCMRVDSKVI